MESGNARQMSYELYSELADELCAPIDASLTVDVRIELYESKIVYLRNLYEQAFRERNGVGETRFTEEDLVRIAKSVSVTSNFLHGVMMERVRESMSRLSERIEMRAA